MTTVARVVVHPAQGRELEIMELALPAPGPHQVVVKQMATGVCHTQVHQINAPHDAPILLGHEGIGIVVATGDAVEHVREGDKVLVSWIPRDAANSDRPPEVSRLTLPDGRVATSPNVFSWADHVICDEQYVVGVPDAAYVDVACIVSCAVLTGAGAVSNTADVQAGESVAVFGVGGVGLAAVTAARIAGAEPIIAVDLDPGKLELARKTGATHTINAAEEDPVARIHELTPSDGFTFFREPVTGVDYAFDCMGAQITTQQAVAATRTGAFANRRGGTAVLVGLPRSGPDFDLVDLLLNEKTLRASLGGSCTPRTDIPRFLDWYASGELDLDVLITRRYSLDDIGDAVADLEAGRIEGRAIITF
jgi:Zn-dependent alcohol dehydrogenase